GVGNPVDAGRRVELGEALVQALDVIEDGAAEPIELPRIAKAGGGDIAEQAQVHQGAAERQEPRNPHGSRNLRRRARTGKLEATRATRLGLEVNAEPYFGAGELRLDLPACFVDPVLGNPPGGNADRHKGRPDDATDLVR